MIPTAFTKTLQTLDRSKPFFAILRLLIAFAVLGGLAYWMLRVPVALYETSADARLEINTASTLVQAEMTGRITETNLTLGKTVNAGDVLVRMDSLPEELLVREEESRMKAIDPQIQAFRLQIVEEERAGIAEQKASAAAIKEAELKIREAETPAKAAEAERQRLERMKKEKLVPERDVEKAIADSERLERVVSTVTSSIERLKSEQQTRDQQRLVRISALRSEITKLETMKTSAQASIRRAGYDVERRVIRAPIAGKIGEAAILRPGSVLSEGSRVASIVPAGQLRIVAYFRPQAAHGRLEKGDLAKLRLKGYPWTEFGVVEARVAEVAGEDLDGRTRVELEVLPSPTLKTTPRHGMPGEVEVEVERTPPLNLVLRTAGQWLTAVRQQ
jgi:multidrug resistance efflux pump